MKEIFDRRTKPDDFQAGDVVLQWDAPHEEKGKHRKDDHLWKGPYKIVAFRRKNGYILEEMEGGLVSRAPVNGRLLKHYFLQSKFSFMSLYIPFLFNISFLDNSLTDLKPEVKAVRSPIGVVIWFFFLGKFLKLQTLKQILRILGKLGTIQWTKNLVYGFLCYLTGRITSLSLSRC